MKKVETTIVISYYQNIYALELILEALNFQSINNFEVILAEDDNNVATETFLNSKKDYYSYPIIHLNQKENIGFRKNVMLNKAIHSSKGETLVFIDGDCIPHKHFVKEFIKNSNEGFILYGRRVMIGEKYSEKILRKKSLSYLHFFLLFFSNSTFVKEGLYFPFFDLSTVERGLLGCNWGIQKTHLLNVNGFDEDYVKPGVGEDVDIEWRLKASGLKMKSMKNKAIVYHLYHPRTYSEAGVQENYALLKKKKLANNIKCLNGLEKIIYNS